MNKNIFEPREPGTLPDSLEKYLLAFKKAAADHGYNLSMISVGKKPDQGLPSATHYTLNDVLVFVAE